jgi:DNA-binding MarR family transcriptional regulator
MPKVARPKTPPPPVTAAMTTVRRWSRYLKMHPIEKLIVDYILWAGRDLRWTMFIGTNLAAVIGNALDINSEYVKHELQSLERRSWIKRGLNDVKQRYVQLTPAFVEASELANQRHEVRRALGPETWQKINGSDELADALHGLALTMPQKRYKDCVKAAVRIFIVGTGNQETPGTPQVPRRDQIGPSQGLNRSLRLIDGERKSGT